VVAMAPTMWSTPRIRPARPAAKRRDAASSVAPVPQRVRALPASLPRLLFARAASTVPTATTTQERVDRGAGSRLGDAWKVIVLNDDHNTFDGVATALAAVVPGVTLDGGMQLAWTIHNTGRAIVWSGVRERAELYWEQLGERGLTMAPLES
jgi:ATP-dependent Clp protease adaptor protein ClpS